MGQQIKEVVPGLRAVFHYIFYSAATATIRNVLQGVQQADEDPPVHCRAACIQNSDAVRHSQYGSGRK